MIRCLFLLSAFLLFTGCRSLEQVQYSFSEEASGTVLEAKVGDEIIVTLAAGEDPTCYWKAVQPVNPKVLLTFDMKRGKAKKIGSEVDIPVIQYRYKIVAEGFSGISLEYKGPVAENGTWEEKHFDLLVKAHGKPLELKDIFEDGPPPDTMTDSKGNVLPKPKDILGRPVNFSLEKQ